MATPKYLSAKFCLFIDGLDEYQGDEEGMIEILTFFSSSDHVKVCASSRPESVYEEVFSNRNGILDVAEYTKADVRTYIMKTLGHYEAFEETKANRGVQQNQYWPGISYLDSLVLQFPGVWLWLVLIVQDISTVNKIMEQIRSPSFLRAYT